MQLIGLLRVCLSACLSASILAAAAPASKGPRDLYPLKEVQLYVPALCGICHGHHPSVGCLHAGHQPVLVFCMLLVLLTAVVSPLFMYHVMYHRLGRAYT